MEFLTPDQEQNDIRESSVRKVYEEVLVQEREWEMFAIYTSLTLL